MSLTILILVVSLIIAAILIWGFRKSGEASKAISSSETRLMTRFDQVLEATGRWREESRSVVQEKISELYSRVEDQNRAARAEMQQTLEQFRATLEANRAAVGEELSRNRSESRTSWETVSRNLTERFEKLQASNELKLTEIRGEVEKKLEQTQQNMGERLKDVQDRLSELHETNQRIMQFSKDLDELQNILRAPRLRGEVGEYEMERMLGECLATEQFATQYEIESSRVDAVIFNREGKLPIDSKFPLEAWRRLHNAELSDTERSAARREFIKAVKSHIDTIASKYIRPPFTMDFAVMYIPAEGVYYELLETPELSEHARNRRVFPASPMTFWALLQVTVVGFRGMKITEEARKITGLLVALRDDLQKVQDAFDKASKQIGHAKSNMDEAANHLERFNVKLGSIHTSSLPENEEVLKITPSGADSE